MTTRSKNNTLSPGDVLLAIKTYYSNKVQDYFVCDLLDDKATLLIITNRFKSVRIILNYIENECLQKLHALPGQMYKTVSNEVISWIWIFEGTRFNLYDTDQNTLLFSIAVEFNINVNLTLMNQIFITDNKLNMYGNIAINNLIIWHDDETNTKKIQTHLNQTYDNLKKLNKKGSEFTSFLKGVDDIFAKCHLYYKSTSVNILQNVLSHFNPVLIDHQDVYIGNDRFNVNLNGKRQKLMEGGYSNKYLDLVTEVNALTLETSIGGTAKNANLRCMINAFISYINKVILVDNKGICVKSGGEVFRYYGDPTPYTNDIDVKVFYNEKNTDDETAKLQSEILKQMLCMRYMIKVGDYVNNIRIRSKKTTQEIFNNVIGISFQNTSKDFDSRVRSIFIDISKSTYNGIRLFSLDIFLEMNITMINSDGNYNFKGNFSAAPLDIANNPNNSSITDDELNKIFNTGVSNVANKVDDNMYILSVPYLINDLEQLIQKP